MLVQRLAAPVRHGLQVVVVGLVEDVVHGELAPHHQFLEIGGAVLGVARLGGLDGQRDGDGRDLPVVEVGAHVRGRARLGLAAHRGVMREGAAEIVRQPPLGLGLAALEPLHRADA